MMTDTYKGLEDGRDKLDRLTDLPINVRHQIQEHMTIEDAARMSVLSSNWRHVWASNPKLRISADFCRKRNQTGTIDIINRILLQHYGPIKTFLLDISMIHPSELSVIDLWMLHLSRNGLVELTLRSLEYLNAPYKLPSCVYGVELEHLNLSYCIFRPPCSFGGFHKLKSLKLDGVAFELDIATSFLSVPNLLDLMFVRCSGLHHLNLYAPELLCLTFFYCGIETIKWISFKDCQKLKSFAVIPQEEVSQNRQHEAMNLVKLLSSLPKVRGLILDGCSLKFLASGNVARRLSTMLNHLDSLEFYGFDFNDEDQICSLLCILRSCLNLKLLKLLLSRIKKGSRKVDLNQLKGQGCSIDELNNLQALRIHRFHGSKLELRFVRLVLASAPILEKMIINVDEEVSERQATKISKIIGVFAYSRPALTQVICQRHQP
ncbi:F-box/FBD/LRR-repeat protein At1g13570 [Nicotiana tabacum]|uniref:F-box/FBD/LRR-repeat protein At1g13570 n=3 Tax=Nicotiana tabacum TaxID=4097 RepID=A0A1S3Y2T2_TOBAC|nr:PREDICTED: F-box/FBD/LRR-repeat protein At1g13570-like [Nicotiana tabacum]XP_016446511.1 PREDICTED: F-box/FBD/LRR-repeat protein At1g13570-like [Nicotiana tabacum]XP_016446512.1 PREDICTED: F-box/FBD/LRR-repeat protein At1g13570-like [Nicotiana tabacum]XP_016446513.1 PREDICTED: F-box/FBD/LRR-repeat protein At1g13570-like [Nicotiana tabacum]XP_016446515.1 PREDICTED: F-box/FBD/LRR-repeat protein At1g13570-like [Nicotiana tabacum]